MRSGKNAEAVSVYRPTVASAATGGRTVTYPNAATATIRGQLVRADPRTMQTPGGRDFTNGYWLYLPKGTDVRPMERSDYEESTPDRLAIDGRNYLCLFGEKMHGLGEPVRAWLLRERD